MKGDANLKKWPTEEKPGLAKTPGRMQIPWHSFDKQGEQVSVLQTPEQEYSEHRQNYLNHYFQTKVGKELPKQFPEPLSIGKLAFGNLAFQILQTLWSQNLPKLFSGRLQVSNSLPD